MQDEQVLEDGDRQLLEEVNPKFLEFLATQSWTLDDRYTSDRLDTIRVFTEFAKWLKGAEYKFYATTGIRNCCPVVVYATTLEHATLLVAPLKNVELGHVLTDEDLSHYPRCATALAIVASTEELFQAAEREWRDRREDCE